MDTTTDPTFESADGTLKAFYPTVDADGRPLVLSVTLTHEGVIIDLYGEDDLLATEANTAEELVDRLLGA